MKKNKRKKTIITIFIIILIIIGVWFFFFINKSKRGNIIDNTKNLFPFGQIDIDQPNQNKSGQQSEEEGSQQTDETVKPIKKAGPRLRQVSFFPTGGFSPNVRIEDKDIVDITINADGTKTETEKTVQIQNNYVRYSSIDDATFYDSKIDPYEIKEEILVENYIPNAEHVLFSNDGNHAILQYWNKRERTPETYISNISKVKLEVNKCPYDFSKQIKPGDDNNTVYSIHNFLNKNPLTRIAVSGTNSPGNESSLAVPATVTAIKNFQSLYELDIDGKLGPATQKKMLDICNNNELKKAKKEFNNLKRKYKTTGLFLPKHITSITINPDGDKLFYIEQDKLGSVGVVRDFFENKDKTIFESTYSDWLVDWNNENNIELTTRSSYKSKGYTYGLDPISGDYHKSFKQVDGLTTLVSPDNKRIFIHEIKDNTIKNSIFTRKIGRNRNVSIQTFTEKCVWTKDSKNLYCLVPNSLKNKEKYPDVWYQGMETYSDSLYKINGRTGVVELVSDFPVEYGKNLDIFKIGIDDNSDYLYFIDKKTEYLWSYRLFDV